MACTEERNCLEDELVCKIAGISCEINLRETVGRDRDKLWYNVTRLQNIKWVIDNMYCDLTCDEVESFRCIVKKIKN